MYWKHDDSDIGYAVDVKLTNYDNKKNITT